MSIAPGARLGVFEVSARIGAGGMGEVYRATDAPETPGRHQGAAGGLVQGQQLQG